MNEALDKIIQYTFTTYSGCLIEKKGSEYIALKHSFSNIEAAKVFIDQSFLNLKQSIK